MNCVVMMKKNHQARLARLMAFTFVSDIQCPR